MRPVGIEDMWSDKEWNKDMGRTECIHCKRWSSDKKKCKHCGKSKDNSNA